MSSIFNRLLSYFSSKPQENEIEIPEEMKYLIVGLGNIGPKYAFTRHNIGFMALDRLVAQEGLKFTMDKQAYHALWKTKGRQIHLIKPTTFMNLSGKALQYWMRALKIKKENVLVLVDDLSLPVGKLRLKPKGSDAGHNGLKDIARVLQDTNYARLKIGIGDNFPKGRQIDHVLGEFSEGDMILIMNKLEKVKEMILSFTTIGIERTMNTFNE